VGYIDPATVPNVTKKSVPIFTDLFIISNNILSDTFGKKNILLVVFIAIFSIFSLSKYQKTKHNLWIWLILGVNILGFIFYSTAKWQYLEMVNCGLLAYLFIQHWRNTKENIEKKQLWFLLFLTFIPTLFLIVMTFKNGHTFGLTQRYSGFSFPYAIIFVSMALLKANSKLKPLNFFIWSVFAVQLFFVGKTVVAVLNDESLKYNYRDKARGKNPYPIIASELVRQYQTGDTIAYPSYVKTFYAGDVYVNSIKKSVLDAQYVNLYLPKDADYIQTIDAKEPNKVMLRKRDGKKIEIFDFKGDTFRY
jgi:hypothetical protein